jgi:hypothetical protein
LLEPVARKRAWPVLRGRGRGNASSLPDEIYFSAVQRKALTPDDFFDLDEVAERLLAFQDRYDATSRPFDWTFARDDLNELLTRISRHDRHTPQPLPQ